MRVSSRNAVLLLPRTSEAASSLQARASPLAVAKRYGLPVPAKQSQTQLQLVSPLQEPNVQKPLPEEPV